MNNIFIVLECGLLIISHAHYYGSARAQNTRPHGESTVEREIGLSISAALCAPYSGTRVLSHRMNCPQRRTAIFMGGNVQLPSVVFRNFVFPYPPGSRPGLSILARPRTGSLHTRKLISTVLSRVNGNLDRGNRKIYCASTSKEIFHVFRCGFLLYRRSRRKFDSNRSPMVLPSQLRLHSRALPRKFYENRIY